MPDFFTKITAFFAAIICFLGSFGIGKTQSIKLIIDSENDVSDAYVYYVEENKAHEIVKYELIGKTDENGAVLWKKPQYGTNKIYVTFIESANPLENDDVKTATIEVSRFNADDICITL